MTMTPTKDETAAPNVADLPHPKGWKLLCAVPVVEDKFGSTGLIKPETVMRIEEHSTTVLYVIKMGELAFKDDKKFPQGPWCSEGDFVLVRAYAGTRFKVHGQEFRLINDDQVEAVVDDPRGYTRA
jgi:co-chaperonin GroES (HSP10)